MAGISSGRAGAASDPGLRLRAGAGFRRLASTGLPLPRCGRMIRREGAEAAPGGRREALGGLREEVALGLRLRERVVFHAPRGRERRAARGKGKAREDGTRGVGWVDRGKDPHRPAALRAHENVNGENALGKLRPGKAARTPCEAARITLVAGAGDRSARRCSVRRRTLARGISELGGSPSSGSGRARCRHGSSIRSPRRRPGARRASAATPRSGLGGHNAISVACAWPEDAVVPHEMGTRPRHERGEPLHELDRLEDDVRRAVAPALLEAVEQPPVALPGESACRDRRSRHVTTQPLEPKAIPCRHGHVGMQAHAVHAGAALALELREILGVDAIAEAKRSLSGTWTGGGAAGDGGCLRVARNGSSTASGSAASASGPRPSRSSSRQSFRATCAATRATSASSGAGSGKKRGPCPDPGS